MLGCAWIEIGSVLTVWLWISCDQQIDKGKEKERGMSPAGGTAIEAKLTKREIERGKDIQRGRVYSQTEGYSWELWLCELHFWRETSLKTLKTWGCNLMQSQSTACSSGSWLRSASPAEVLMLLGLEQAGRGPSYQKWALPRGTATDPCYWLWQSCHSGCLWAFHTHVGGTATHPNLTQLELIL